MQAYGTDIQAAASKYGMNPKMIAAIIFNESHGWEKAPDGGLMQVDANTISTITSAHPELQGLTESDLENNPQDAIMAGTAYLSDMSKLAGGDVDKTLRAYNSGPLNINNLSNPSTGDPNYITKINTYMAELS